MLTLGMQQCLVGHHPNQNGDSLQCRNQSQKGKVQSHVSQNAWERRITWHRVELRRGDKHSLKWRKSAQIESPA